MLRVTILTLLAASADACTTLIVGKKASVDGSVMCTHSDDGEANPDSRLVKVPASDHAEGSTRPIYYDTEDYPRFVGDRGVDAYLPKNNPGATPSVAIGSIPQVAHTYAYFEGNYGMQNEHQVGIGESTCSAVFAVSTRSASRSSATTASCKHALPNTARRQLSQRPPLRDGPICWEDGKRVARGGG